MINLSHVIAITVGACIFLEFVRRMERRKRKQEDLAKQEAAKVDKRKRFAIPRRRPMQTFRMWDSHWQKYHTVSVIFAMPLHRIEEELDHQENKERYDERHDNR